MKTDVIRLCALNETDAKHKVVETLYFIGVDVNSITINNVSKVEGKDSYTVVVTYNADEYNKQNKKERLLKEKEMLEGKKDYTRLVDSIMGKDVEEQQEALEFRPRL